MAKKLITLLLASVFASAASAKDVGYDYFTAGWNQVDVDFNSVSFDLDGINLGGSFSILPEWYIKLDTLRSSGDENGVDLDFDLTTINAGYHMPMASNIDFIAELGYASSDVDASGFGQANLIDDSGANLLVGFRGFATPEFEWGINAQYFNLDNSSTFINLEGRYYLTNTLSLGLKASFESDVNIYGISARFDF